MSRKLSLPFFLIAFLIVGAVAQAQTGSQNENQPSITFPIADLGNCGSKNECRTYCDDPAHREACFAFAEAHGLMSKDETKEARKLSGIKGPGGCTGSQCKTYCDDVSHGEECLKFAKDHKLISEKEIKLVEEIQQKGGPGSCKSKEECMAYCSDSVNEAECRAFATSHGLTPPGGEDPSSRLGEVGKQGNPKIQAILEAKGGPGGCKIEDACRQYCSDPAHGEECLAFGKNNNLITEGEFKEAQKLSATTGPGGCKGFECKTYCQDLSHREECFKFGKEHGLISKDEVDHIEKIDQNIKERGGPGGCTDAVSCGNFCSDPANREMCQNFAKEHGLSPEGTNIQNGRPENMPRPNEMHEGKIQNNQNGEQGENQRQNQGTNQGQNENRSESFKPLINNAMQRPSQDQMKSMTPEQMKQYDQYKSQQGGDKQTAPANPREEKQMPPQQFQGQWQGQNGEPQQPKDGESQMRSQMPPRDNMQLPSGMPQSQPRSFAPPPSTGNSPPSGGTPPPVPPTSMGAFVLWALQSLFKF